jgi:cytochrome c553
MPKWYAVHQLKKFKQGLRGAMPEDTSGYMMHNTAKNLDDDMIEKVSDYLLKLKPVEIQNTLNGNPVNGKWMFQDYCMGCHRYNASGELVFGSPPLYHLQDWYLKAQMQKFSHKLRGSHPSDLKGAKMVDVMAILPFPNATDDILAYIATLTQREKKK